MASGAPPGRMGLVWLRDRMSIAGRAREVLEQKLHVLAGRASELEREAERTRLEWEATCRTAERWLLTARLVGGAEQVRTLRAALPRDATVSLRSERVVGVRYPIDPRYDLPVVPGAAALGRTSALPFAAAAYREAVAAAGRHAVAVQARRLLGEELERTAHRLRSIERRWIPKLEAAMHETAAKLDESDREDTVRIKWVTQRRR